MQTTRTPLATGQLYGRTWTVHRAISEPLGQFAAARLEWSYDDETETRHARRGANGDDGKVWSRAAKTPEVAAEITRVTEEWKANGGAEQAQRDAELRIAEAAALRTEAEKRGRACFIRFGRLPAAGCSWNHRDSRTEPGVSVYRAWHLDGARYVIDLSGMDTISATFIIDDDQPVYRVTGTELEATGADGEPLIADAKARRVRPAEIRTVI